MKLRVRLFCMLAVCALLLIACAHQSEEVSYVKPGLLDRPGPMPVYPSQSIDAHEEGKVVLHVTVAVDGSAQGVEVKWSSGIARLDRAAMQAVQRWRFKPATSGGMPVAADIDVPVNFQLKEYLPALKPGQVTKSAPPTKQE